MAFEDRNHILVKCDGCESVDYSGVWFETEMDAIEHLASVEGWEFLDDDAGVAYCLDCAEAREKEIAQNEGDE